MNITDNSTISDGREFVKENCEKGVNCPCCDKKNKTYNRSLCYEVMLFLDLLVKHCGNDGEFIDTRKFIHSNMKASSNGVFLVHWGFIERGPGRGKYRPTPEGRLFARGLTHAPAYAVTLNNKVLRWSEERTTAAQARLKPFDMDETMQTTPVELEEAA